jgi:hypothetical protein
MEKSARLFAQAYEQSTKPTDCQSVYEPRRLSRAGSGMPQGTVVNPASQLPSGWNSVRGELSCQDARLLVAICFG